MSFISNHNMTLLTSTLTPRAFIKIWATNTCITAIQAKIYNFFINYSQSNLLKLFCINFCTILRQFTMT